MIFFCEEVQNINIVLSRNTITFDDSLYFTNIRCIKYETGFIRRKQTRQTYF